MSDAPGERPTSPQPGQSAGGGSESPLGSVGKLLRKAGVAPKKVETGEDLKFRSHADSDRADHEAEVELRKRVGKWSINLMIAQVGIADIVFVTYAWYGRNWDLPSEVIGGWLAATVVQVIGVATIVTRSLFPPDRKREYVDKEDRDTEALRLAEARLEEGRLRLKMQAMIEERQQLARRARAEQAAAKADDPD